MLMTSFLCSWLMLLVILMLNIFASLFGTNCTQGNALQHTHFHPTQQRCTPHSLTFLTFLSILSTPKIPSIYFQQPYGTTRHWCFLHKEYSCYVVAQRSDITRFNDTTLIFSSLTKCFKHYYLSFTNGQMTYMVIYLLVESSF